MSFYVTDCSISKPVGYLCDIRINSALQLVINTSTITLLPFNLKKTFLPKFYFVLKWDMTVASMTFMVNMAPLIICVKLFVCCWLSA